MNSSATPEAAARCKFWSFGEESNEKKCWVPERAGFRAGRDDWQVRSEFKNRLTNDSRDFGRCSGIATGVRKVGLQKKRQRGSVHFPDCAGTDFRCGTRSFGEHCPPVDHYISRKITKFAAWNTRVHKRGCCRAVDDSVHCTARSFHRCSRERTLQHAFGPITVYHCIRRSRKY